jgi:hypothetical protein
MVVTRCEKQVDHYVTKPHIFRSLNLYRTQLFFALSSIHFVSSAILEQFETVDQALDFIASAPCLEVIQYWDVRCSESSNYSSQAIVPPLRQIRFKPDLLLDIIMDWFCRCHPTPSVHTLEIDQLPTGDNIYNFIRYLGSALENLTIPTFDRMGGAWTPWSKCISGRYIIITIITFISWPKQKNQSIPEYFSSQYLLNVDIQGFTKAKLL